MNTKFLLAALAAFVACFRGGWVVYGMLLMDRLKDAMVHPEWMNAGEPNMGLITLGSAIMGVFYAWLLQGMGVGTWMRGAGVGAIAALLISAGGAVMMSAQMDWYKDMSGSAMDILGSVVLGALAGAAAGAVLGMKKKEA